MQKDYLGKNEAKIARASSRPLTRSKLTTSVTSVGKDWLDWGGKSQQAGKQPIDKSRRGPRKSGEPRESGEIEGLDVRGSND